MQVVALFIVCLAVTKICEANYCVYFKFSSFVNKNGRLKNGDTCDAYTECDTKLAVCVSSVKNNCSNYQYTETFENSNNVNFNPNLTDLADLYVFCEQGPVPAVIFVHIKALDMDGNLRKLDNSEVISTGSHDVKTESMPLDTWKQVGNPNSTYAVKIVFYLKIQTQSTTPTVVHDQSSSNTTPNISKIRPLPVLPQDSTLTDGLVLPWWLVTGTVGALVGALIVAATVVLRKKRQSQVIGQASISKVSSILSVRGPNNPYVHKTKQTKVPPVSYTRGMSYESVGSCPSNQYETLDAVNLKTSVMFVDETQACAKADGERQGESPYSVPSGQAKCSVSVGHLDRLAKRFSRQQSAPANKNTKI